jgi:hypothetical protein
MIINSDRELELRELEIVCGGGAHSGSPPTVVLADNNPLKWKIERFMCQVNQLEGRAICE